MRNFFDISLCSFLSDEAEANNLKFHEELASDKKEKNVSHYSNMTSDERFIVSYSRMSEKKKNYSLMKA